MPDGIEEAVAAAGPCLINDLHEMAELAFGESAHFKPCEILDGKVDDGHAGGRIVLRAKHTEWHIQFRNFAEGFLGGWLGLGAHVL